MFDTLCVPCPDCGCDVEFQSKAGQCYLHVYALDDCPLVILADVANYPENCSKCGAGVSVVVSHSTTVKSVGTDPYLIESVTTKVKKYNPSYGDDRTCKCGHSYYRHFDSCNHMEDVGCIYCDCDTFSER